MDYKTTVQAIKAIEDRSVVGIPTVHGNVDDGGDRSHPGSHAEPKVNGRNRTRFLWMHNANEPPIAVIDYVKEITADELPDAVREFAPDATGGVEIKRTYLDTPRGNEVLIGIKAGVIDEMSYAYDAKEYSFTEDDALRRTIRELYKMEIYDYSDVTWGMNPATLGSKSGLLAGLPFADHFATVHAAVVDVIERAEAIKALRAKDGRDLSTSHYDRLKSLQVSLVDAQTTLAGLIEPLKQPPADDLILESERLKSQSHALRLRILNLGVSQ